MTQQEEVDEVRFRKWFMKILAGNRTIVSAVSRNMATQQTLNGPKVEASKAVSSSVLQATADLSIQVETGNDSDGVGRKQQTGTTIHTHAVSDSDASRHSERIETGGSGDRFSRRQKQIIAMPDTTLKLEIMEERRAARNWDKFFGPTVFALRDHGRPSGGQRSDFPTQGGGKGMGAQTGVKRPRKPNDGRLHERPPKQKSGDTTSEYAPSDDSSSAEGGTPQKPKRKRQRRANRSASQQSDRQTPETGKVAAGTQKRSDHEDEGDQAEDDADDGDGGSDNPARADEDDSGTGPEEGDDGGGEGDDDDDDDDEVEGEQSDASESESDKDGSDSDGAVEVTPSTSSKAKRSPAEVPAQSPVTVGEGSAAVKPESVRPIINGDLWSLPPDHEDFYEKVQDTSDYSDTDDGGDLLDFATHFEYVEGGIVVNSDEADETYKDDMPDGDSRKPVPLSKRTKYYSPMKEQSMKAFARIDRFDPHEKGCYLSLGNPPNIFDFSTPLRLAAQEEARKVFLSHVPFAGKEGREVKFKEKVWNKNQGCYATAKFSPKGAAIADAMHTFAQYVLTGLLKTAPHGSTFFEMVNHVSFKKAVSPSMMLRSQVDPYRTIFTTALSYAKDLHCQQYKKPEHAPPLPLKLQRMAVMEMICRSKSITKSRVNCHKVDDNGVKVELEKRKQRKAKMRDENF